MNPKQFLQIGGVILVVVGILGIVGILGPTSDSSIFGEAWWFDAGENWAHLIIGLVGLLAAYKMSEGGQKTLVMVLGVVAVLIGLYSLLVSPVFLGSNLENPADSILHLVVGAWALFAAKAKHAATASMGNPGM